MYFSVGLWVGEQYELTGEGVMLCPEKHGQNDLECPAAGFAPPLCLTKLCLLKGLEILKLYGTRHEKYFEKIPCPPFFILFVAAIKVNPAGQF